MRSELIPWTIRGVGLAIGVGFVYVVVTIAAQAASVLLLVFLAVLLASGLEPAIGWIRGRVPLGRGATILLVYAAFFVSVVALAFIVVPGVINQFNDVVSKLPPFLDRAREWASSLRPTGLATSIGALVDGLEQVLTPPPPDPDDVVEVGLTVAEVAVSLATLLAIVFFWLVEHARLQRYTLAFLPAHRRAGARTTWNAIETRLGLWVRGQLILMGSIGLATGVALTLLGVPSALLLAFIAALTEAIPIIGPVLGAVPAVLVAATVSPELALIVAGVYLLIQIVEGNVLVPIVMRNSIGISPFLIILSLLVGGTVGGIIGAVLAVPAAATIEVILERLQARRVPVSQDPGGPDATQEAIDEHGVSLPDAARTGRVDVP